MLAALAIIHLVIAARDTAKLVHQGERLDHFVDDTGNGNRIVGMRFGTESSWWNLLPAQSIAEMVRMGNILKSFPAQLGLGLLAVFLLVRLLIKYMRELKQAHSAKGSQSLDVQGIPGGAPVVDTPASPSGDLPLLLASDV